MADDTGSNTQKSPDEIREDIEQTREQLGDTVEALGAKTDIKGQAQAKVEDIKGNVRQQADDLKAKVTSGGGDGPASQGSAPQKAQQAGQQVVAKVQTNPLPVAIAVALVLGYLIGRRRAA